MVPQTTKSSASKQEGYAKKRFALLTRFHRIAEPANWQFNEQDVIAFLKMGTNQEE